MQKIMFDTKLGLEQAVLDGRKTMTRRIVRNPKELKVNDLKYLETEKPRYKVGEVVAVAQSYKYVMEARGESGVSRLVAKAGYKNKMFVKADLMPHQIRIKNVRVERLQDISIDDCLKEGVKKIQLHDGSTRFVAGYFDGNIFSTAGGAFASMIDEISGRGTWGRNPWVFIYEFELIK